VGALKLTAFLALLLQNCHIDIKEDQLAKLMVAEGFVHGAEVIMRAETFKRCLLHVRGPHLIKLISGGICLMSEQCFHVVELPDDA
jgi:hypothetical protein